MRTSAGSTTLTEFMTLNIVVAHDSPNAITSGHPDTFHRVLKIAADEIMASLGFEETYRVGGSVRDELLGVPVKDHDYVIRNQSLERIEAQLVIRGIHPKPLRLRDSHVVVGVRFSHPRTGLVEVVLPRTERSTGPGHRDFRIVCKPTVSLKDDALRRDFTMNALYRSVHTGTISDPLGRGLDDLEKGWIKTTHPDSFRDDPLRTLRALRFASVLGFDLVESTFEEMTKHAAQVTALTLKGVSGTALTELEKLLMGAQPARALCYMRDTGVLHVLLPELAATIGFEQRNQYHDTTVDEHTFNAVQAAAGAGAPLRVRMALLFHDAGKPWMAWRDPDGVNHYYAVEAERTIKPISHKIPPTAIYSHEWWGAWLAGRALERLNAPASLRRDVHTLIERHMLPLHDKVRRMKVHTWRAELGDSMLRDLVLHRRCDVLGKPGDVGREFATLQAISDMQQEAINNKVPRCVKDLQIRGEDLLAIGANGEQVGVILDKLLHDAMAQPKLNTSGWLLERASKFAR